MKDDTPIIIQADALGSIQKAQQEAEIRNAAIRQAERQAKMDVWQDPEVMAYRKALSDKSAIESLWSLQAAGQCDPVRDFPIPPDDQLPKELRGQAPSTIRRMLGDYPEWREKMKAHVKSSESKSTRLDELKKKFPEGFGIDFGKVRKEENVTLGDEHKVRDGKRVQHSSTATDSMIAMDRMTVKSNANPESSETKMSWSAKVSRWLGGK